MKHGKDWHSYEEQAKDGSFPVQAAYGEKPTLKPKPGCKWVRVRWVKAKIPKPKKKKGT